MRAIDLIRRLQEYDDNTEVSISDWQEGYLPPTPNMVIVDNFEWDDKTLIKGIVIEGV